MAGWRRGWSLTYGLKTQAMGKAKTIRNDQDVESQLQLVIDS